MMRACVRGSDHPFGGCRAPSLPPPQEAAALVGLLLARMDCQIDFCENGQLAVERVQQEVFHLILMDVNMPVMDGLTATRLIRALPGTVARTPIVVVTADVMNEARDHALLAGANDFISKPLNVEQLRGIVQRYAAAGMA